MNRRQLITGLISLVAAPAIVRAGSLMPISGDRYFVWQWRSPILPDIGGAWQSAFEKGVSFADYSKPCMGPNGHIQEGTWTFFGKDRNIYSDEQIGFSKRELDYPVAMAA